jgi:hypothetical protein
MIIVIMIIVIMIIIVMIIIVMIMIMIMIMIIAITLYYHPPAEYYLIYLSTEEDLLNSNDNKASNNITHSSNKPASV